MNFHRTPFVILSIVALALAGSLTYFYAAWRESPGPEYDWGGNSTLGINLTLSGNDLGINGTLNYTITLKNTGWESIRVWTAAENIRLRIYSFLSEGGLPEISAEVEQFQINSSKAKTIFGPAEFNRRLTVLGPGEDIAFGGTIRRGSPGLGGWNIQAAGNLTAIAEYDCHEKKGYPYLPYWIGHVDSNRESFAVVP